MSLIKKNLYKKPVAIFMDKKIESIVFFMGAAYSGNFYVVLDTKMPPKRIEKIMENVVDTGIIEKVKEKIIDTDILYVLFTSGSTGTPKGVILPHRSVITYIEWGRNLLWEK